MQKVLDFCQGINEDLFVSVLREVVSTVAGSHLDKRSKELIADALNFTIDSPKEIFRSMTFDGMTSSNLSAFSMMLNTINQSPIRPNIRIKKLVHDEQKEFAHFLKKSFSVFSKVMIPAKNLLISEPVPVDIIEQAELKLISSSKSYGIQLTDTALWIFKRYLNGQLKGLDPELLKQILDRTYWDGISFFHHQRGVIDGLEELGKKTFTADQVERGMALKQEMEKSRWKTKKRLK